MSSMKEALKYLVTMIFMAQAIMSVANIEEKQNKMHACSVLARDRAIKDSEYVKFVASFVSPNNEEEGFNSLMSILMITCYKNIKPKAVEDVLNAAKAESVNSMSKEYIKVLDLEKWENIYSSNDESKVKEEMVKYSDAIRDVQAVQAHLDPESNKRRNQEPREDQQQDDEYSVNSRRRPVKEDLSIFGIDISKLSESSKMILGLSLLILLGSVFIYFARKAIKELPGEKVRKSKKSKDKKE